MTDHPLTYHEAMDLSLRDQIARYEELTGRNLVARSIAALQARGGYSPGSGCLSLSYSPRACKAAIERAIRFRSVSSSYRAIW